jgi:DNA mismatch repair protein MutS2
MDKKALVILQYPQILQRLEDYCEFDASRKKVRNLFPSRDFERVQVLQAQTAEAKRLFSLHPRASVGGARDITDTAADARRGVVLEPHRMLDVKSTLVAARNLKRSFQRLEGDFPRLKHIAEQLPPSLGLVDAISQAISEKGDILDTASERLGTIRRDIKIQHERLRKRMESMVNSERVSKYLQEPIFTQRAGRYVIPIRAGAKGQIKGIVHDQSASGATLYLEPQSMVDHNNRYRQLQIEEREEERRILRELSARIGQHAQTLHGMVETLADLDLAFARGKYADDLDAVQPKLHPFPDAPPGKHPGMVLRLYGARHPLLPADEVVPIDVLFDDQTYAMIITGPNTGGKTVTLKTVGLLTLMAQAGLHIPAAPGSEFSFFRKVFADIGDEQSIEQSLSTFSGHITNIIHILENADRRSLVLLDELGAGTDPQEGAALARALMSHLLERGITSLVTTHHPELKMYAHSTPGVTNASVEFDLETLQPTYHLTIGLPGRSNALSIASRLGLSREIIEQAKEELNPADLKADDLLDEIHRQRELAQEARQAAEKTLAEAKEKRETLSKRLSDLEDERLQVLRKARNEAGQEIKRLREELSSLREKLEQGEQDLAEELEQVEEEIQETEEKVSEPVPRRVPEAPQPRRRVGPIEKGSRVHVRSLGKKGEVRAIDGEDIEVQVGQLRVKTTRDDLEPTESEKRPAPQESSPSQVRKPTSVSSPGTELDLRGQTVDEALLNLEYYLDRAFMAKLPWVRIIHGIGTGTLRKAVRQALRGNPHVENYERGSRGEGGDGVTVVSFKE